MAEDTKTKKQQFWVAQIQGSKKKAERWVKAGKLTIKTYRRDQDREGSQFNVLWANTEILKPATLSRVSRPNITRRFKNDDAVARKVAELLEKVCLFVHDENEFSDELKLARDDFLLPGRGVMRLKYKANIIQRPMERGVQMVDDGEVEFFSVGGQQATPDGFFDDADRDTAFIEDVATEEVIPEYVHWRDFLTSNSRTWGETWWVAFRHGMAKDELVVMFGEDKVKQIELPQVVDQASDGSKRDVFEIWEIWDKRKRQRIWVTEGANDIIEIEDAPLELKNFFPCPKPMVPFSTTDTTTPIPLYFVYMDQADELNTVVHRLTELTEMLKVSGFYDASEEDKIANLGDLKDGQFKGITNAGDFGARGGFADAVWEVPIATIAEVITRLTARKADLKAEIFELTGMADIMRGHTDPSEGVGTQRIKTVMGTIRLRPLREPVEDFIRESYEIISEIAADKFSPQTFQAYTGEAPSKEVMDLMKNDNLRQFRVNVETDSTVIPNEEIDKARATEFLTSMSAFLSQMLPVVTQVPQLAPLVGEMAKFGARSFKAGRELEDVLTESIDSLTQQAGQPQQGQQEPPDSKVQVAQINQQTVIGKAQMEAQAKTQSDQLRQQTELIKLEVTRQIEAARNETTIQKNVLDVIAGGQGPIQ